MTDKTTVISGAHRDCGATKEDISMRILFIINQLGGGGAERVLTIIANHLADNNEVHILSFSPGVSKYPIDNRVLINEVSLIKKRSLSIASEIRKEVKRIRPDSIISFEYHMNMKALLGTIGLHGFQKIVSERNDPANKGNRIGIKQLRAMLYRFADVLVCQTPDAKAYFSKTIQKKTVVIPNPVSDALPAPWTGEREKRVVNFCRLEPQKNIPLLIDAFESFHSSHPEYTLEIYGDGSEYEPLVQYIARKKLEGCVFLFPSTPDIHQKVWKASMFVSTSDYEGLSNSMLEALALGIPTICTDCPCGGAKMMIRNGENGYLAKVGDAYGIAQLMVLIADNQEISTRLSESGKKIRGELSSRNIVDKWETILQ